MKDPVRTNLTGRYVHHVQNALLTPVLGEAVGEERPVLARVPPVERRRPLGVQRVGIEQHTVRAIGAVPTPRSLDATSIEAPSVRMA